MQLSGFDNELCQPVTSLFAYLGIAAALSLTALGSAYGTARSALGMFKVYLAHPEIKIRGLIPIILAGIVGIYGLVYAVVIATSVTIPYHLFSSYAALAGGLGVGLTGLSSGFCIGVAGEHAVKALAQQPKLLMGAMLILIFGEVLGLYGFIISVILSAKKGTC